MVKLLAPLLLVALANAQEMPALEMVKPPEARLTKKIVLVVDGSSSMAGKYAQAVELATIVASQSSDEYEINVIIFGDNSVTWPTGWVKLPSKDEADRVKAWLILAARSQVYGGSTRPNSAMEKAYKLDKNASIIMVTDGEFNVDKVKPVAKGRVCLLLQLDSADYESLEEFAKSCTGGHFRLAKKK